jgi:asparagine synthase (glutamine-hydrolysing)
MLERIYAFSDSISRDEAELYVPRLYYMHPADALTLLPEGVIPLVDTDRYMDRVRKLFSSCSATDDLSRMLFVDLNTSLADEMLSKVDRMTMASGLEARVPLLDHRVVELAMRIPGAIKRDSKKGKLPLRRLVGKRLGLDVGERPKTGFNSPFARWMRNDATTKRVFDQLWPHVEESGAFDVKTLSPLKLPVNQNGHPNAMNMFTLLVFGLWARQRDVRVS